MKQTEIEIEMDALLGEHIQGELDGLPGGTERFFTCRIQSKAVSRRIFWNIRTAITAGALAAMLCIASGLFAHRNGQSGKSPIKPVVVATSHPIPKSLQMMIPIEQSIAYRTVDAGPVRTKDSSPARQLRREIVQTLRWYDPAHHEQMQVTVPSEQVVLIKMPAF